MYHHQNDSTNEVWTHGKLTQLENYLEGKGSWPHVALDFFLRLDYTFLAQLLQVDAAYVEMKLDELHASELQKGLFQGDRDFNRLVEEWNQPGNVAYQSAQNTLKELHLEAFVSPAQALVHHEEPEAIGPPPQLNHFIRPNPKRKSSISKPAAPSATNINVLTKPEVKPAITTRKLRRFSFLQKDEPPPPVRSRRVSMVGENLPGYIRQQLEVPSEESSTILRQMSRIQNLEINSQLLYSNSKTSEHVSTDYNDLSSDYDREYILPQLLQLEELRLQLRLDVDFVDVGSDDDDYLFSR